MAKQIENVLTLVKTLLTTNLPTKLTAVQTEMGADVKLIAPRSTSYYIHELDELVDLPCVQILPDKTNMVLTGLKHDECDHNVIIVCHNVAYEGKIDVCAKRSYRFARAVWEVILADRTLTNQVIEMYVTSIDYKPIFSDGNGFKQEVWIYLTIKTEER